MSHKNNSLNIAFMASSTILEVVNGLYSTKAVPNHLRIRNQLECRRVEISCPAPANANNNGLSQPRCAIHL